MRRNYIFPQDKDIEEDDNDMQWLIDLIKRTYKITELSNKCYKVSHENTVLVVSIKDKKLHGMLKAFTVDGDLISMTQYFKGNKTGIYLKCHDNGKVAVFGSFMRDSAYGTWTFYDRTGEIIDEQHYN